MTPLHMGSLHALEVALVVVLAVGPFLALGAVVVVARRRDRDPEPEAVETTTTEPQPQENSWC